MAIVPFEDVPSYFRQIMGEGEYGRVLDRTGVQGDESYKWVITHAFQTYQANRDNWNSAAEFIHVYTQRAFQIIEAFMPFSAYMHIEGEKGYIRDAWEKWGELVRSLMIGTDLEV